jgi:signal transduction histidine kinase
MLSDLIELVSQPPGNVIYHLITLFALQIIFAISFSHWRRNRHDRSALRMAWAAGIIFLLRLGLMVAGLIQPQLATTTVVATTAVSILPPLEQALHTVTAALLVWAIVPHPQNPDFERVSYTILFTVLGIITIAAIFFTQSWQVEALNQIAYNESDQATVWGLLQILLLGFGLMLVLASRTARFSLRSSILGLLLLAHLAHFWNAPEIIPTQTDVPYLLRLGDLVVFPLWAILVYQQTLIPLLSGRDSSQVKINRRALQLATQIIQQQQEGAALQRGLEMVTEFVPARFIGLLTYETGSPQQLYLVRQTGNAGVESQQWQLNRNDWPALQHALEKGDSLELKPGGTGARQLRLLYEELGIGDNGSLLVEPLPGRDTVQGLLLLGRGPGYRQWAAADAALAQPIAAYLGQVISTLRQINAPAEERPLHPSPDTIVAPSGRLIALEEERNRLANDLAVAQNRARQAERRAAEARKQAEDLAATVEAIEKIQPVADPAQVLSLEAELESLRESLTVAEEAMAMAAASEGGLSTEWIMTTITRYSGQLEEAQAQIQQLQKEMDERSQADGQQIVASLAQELRTPMTSIGGYTELLLSESVGMLGNRQRGFLQRVKANVERLNALINQLVQLASAELPPETQISTSVTTDLHGAIDTAVQSVLNQVREKQLHLNLSVSSNLPPVAVPQYALQQILNLLLHNACRSSRQQEQVALNVEAHEIPDPDSHAYDEPLRFVHIAIHDSGEGISIDDQSRVFDPQYQTDHPLIRGVGDTGPGLALAHSLAQSHGGRMWVDSKPGQGSTFSVLFPLSQSSLVHGESEANLLRRNGQNDQ